MEGLKVVYCTNDVTFSVYRGFCSQQITFPAWKVEPKSETVKRGHSRRVASCCYCRRLPFATAAAAATLLSFPPNKLGRKNVISSTKYVSVYYKAKDA